MRSARAARGAEPSGGDVGPLLDTWVYEPLPGSRILILTYGCATDDFAALAHFSGHEAVGLFPKSELDRIPLPAGYARSVRAWMRFRDR